jgi:hypothetical protein
MPELTSGLFSPLPWDTVFFGFPTARIVPPALDEAGLRAALAAMAEAKTELAYWTVEPEEAVSNRAAEACRGFLADVRSCLPSGERLCGDTGRARESAKPWAIQCET